MSKLSENLIKFYLIKGLSEENVLDCIAGHNPFSATKMKLYAKHQFFELSKLCVMKLYSSYAGNDCLMFYACHKCAKECVPGLRKSIL